MWRDLHCALDKGVQLEEVLACASRNTLTTKAPDRCLLTLATSPTHPFIAFSMANGESLLNDFSMSADSTTINLCKVPFGHALLAAVQLRSVGFDVDIHC